MARSVKRGLALAFVVAVLAAAGTAVAWRLAAPSLIEGRIIRALEEQGLTVAALTVRSVGLDRAVLSDVELALAGSLAIDRIDAHYRLGELIGDRRIEMLEVSGVRLALMASDGVPRQPTVSGGVGPTLPAMPVGRIVMQDSAITLATPVGAVALAVDLEAVPDAEGGLALTGEAMLRADAGQARIPFTAAMMPTGAFDASLTTEAGSVSWRGATLDIGEGNVDLSGTLAGLDRLNAALVGTLGLPGGSTAALTFAGDVSGDSGAFAATVEAETGTDRAALNVEVGQWRDRASAVAVSVRADLPLLTELMALVADDVPSVTGGVLDARLAGTLVPGGAAEPSFDGRLRLDAAFDGETTDGVTTLDIDTRLAVERVGAGWSMRADGPIAFAKRRRWVSGIIDLSGSVGRSEDGMAGRIAGTLAASGSLDGALEVTGGRAELSAQFRQRDGRWRVQPDGCMPLTVESLAIGSRLTASEGATACISALPGRPLFAFGAGDPALALDLRADPAVFILDQGTTEALRLQADLPSVTVSAEGLGGPAPSAEIAVADAAVRLPDPGIGFEGVDLAVSTDRGAEPAMQVGLDAARVISLRSPSWFAPLTLTGDSAMSDAGILEFRATALGAGAVTARVEGRHDPESGAGRMTLRLDPISFAPGTRQPVDLAPVLAGTPVGEVTGSVSGRARMAWGPGIASSGELDLEDVTLTVSGVTVRSIDGRLTADSLIPLNLPDGQLLALGGADLGVSLEDGAVSFGLADGDRLSVQGVGFGLAGGSLAVEPFQTRFGDGERAFVVIMRGIDLALLSEQFPVPGLSLTGRFDGRIPVRLIGDTISLENGVLQSTEGGAIRYVPALPIGSAGEGGFALLLDAVRNFQYEALGATVNGRTGEDLEVAIRLEGANPDLYDGFPVALNINLSGDLDEILRSGLSSLAFGDQAGDLDRGE